MIERCDTNNDDRDTNRRLFTRNIAGCRLSSARILADLFSERMADVLLFIAK